MNQRLEQLMRAEGLTSAKFAEILSVQPSSISHLLSGRNKPNFDFIARLLTMFPSVNPRWFINGEGEMYISTQGAEISEPNNPESDKSNETQIADEPATKCGLYEDDILDNKDVTLFTEVTKKPEIAVEIPTQQVAPVNENQKEVEIKPTVVDVNKRSTDTLPQFSAKKIRKVILFYEDNTFESFDSLPF